MPKANIETTNGTKIFIEGESEEIAKIIKLVQGNNSHPTSHNSAILKEKKMKIRFGPMDYIRTLKEEGFFDSPKEIMSIKSELDAKGHIYSMNMLSTPLIRLVRKKELGRLKQGTQWVYVKR